MLMYTSAFNSTGERGTDSFCGAKLVCRIPRVAFSGDFDSQLDGLVELLLR